jgi:Protein of unknown function (DUF3606)
MPTYRRSRSTGELPIIMPRWLQTKWRKRRSRAAVAASRTALVAGGQGYDVKYEAKKTCRPSAAVKKAVKKVGNSRKRIERRARRLMNQSWGS